MIGLLIKAGFSALIGRGAGITAGGRTAAFATGVTWLGVISQVITQLDALPGLESLIGTQGGTIIAILSIVFRAYREITTGPVATR